MEYTNLHTPSETRVDQHPREAEIGAAARAIRVAQASEPDGQRRLGEGWDTYLVNHDEAEVLMRQARATLAAVEPLIRERLAQEVEAERDEFMRVTKTAPDHILVAVYDDIARLITGGESS